MEPCTLPENTGEEPDVEDDPDVEEDPEEDEHEENDPDESVMRGGRK